MKHTHPIVGKRFGHTSRRIRLVYRRRDGSPPPVKVRPVKARKIWASHPLMRRIANWEKKAALQKGASDPETYFALRHFLPAR